MKNRKSNAMHADSVFTGLLPPGASLEEYSGVWDTPQTVHLLKRVLFGATLQNINYFKSKSMSDAVDELLQETAAPASQPLNNYNIDGYVDPTVPAWQTWVNASLLIPDTELNLKRIASLRVWWTGQLVNEASSIHEKMTLFWHNHFATDMYKDPSIRAKFWYDHYLTLRRNALGNFKQLVDEITIDPAMLYFLNGNTNKKESPNENYGRELQELYTAGKGVDSAYTEDDVRAATRVLTGHTVREDNFTYFFDAGQHDDENKNFSSFYSNTIVTGKTGEPGSTELDEMLNMIFATEEMSKHICRKLYRFFIYYVIDEDVETGIITPLAEIFRNNNYEIKPVLSALFKSQHFYDLVYSSACIIKSPLDFIIGLCREYNVAIANGSDEETYSAWQLLMQEGSLLQQSVGAIPEVAGWYAYYLEPSFHETWINSVTYTSRNIFTDGMIVTGITMGSATLAIDPLAFTAQLPAPEDPAALINDALSILLRYPLSEELKTTLKQNILLSGQTNDYYWTTAWTDYINDPNNAAAKDIVLTRLKALYKYCMNLPEYHLS